MALDTINPANEFGEHEHTPESWDHFFRAVPYDADNPQRFAKGKKGLLATTPLAREALDRAIADGIIAIHHENRQYVYLTNGPRMFDTPKKARIGAQVRVTSPYWKRHDGNPQEICFQGILHTRTFEQDDDGNREELIVLLYPTVYHDNRHAIWEHITIPVNDITAFEVAHFDSDPERH